MKKIYLLLPLFAGLFSVTAFAQKSKNGKKLTHAVTPQFAKIINQRTNAIGCDTLNVSESANWTGDLYGSATDGFVSGTNTYGDLQKAQYFDASATGNTFLTRTWIYPAVAASLAPGTQVPIRVYNVNGAGEPGVQIGVTNVTIGDFITAVGNNDILEVDFTPAITLPASKTFFVSVDISNLTATTDSLAIFTSTDGETPADAWEQFSDATWYPMDDAASWGLALSLYIFPFTSTNQTCTVLPVNLLSFNAQKKSAGIELNWKVAQEINMSHYQVERSVDGRSFASVGKVNATNASTIHTYSFVDNAAPAGNVFYRLKQANKDGKAIYSATLSLTDRASGIIKTGGFRGDNIALYINSAATQKLSVALFDMQGRLVSKAADQVVIAGANNLNIPVNAVTEKGIYVLSVIMDGTKYNYKIMKQ